MSAFPLGDDREQGFWAFYYMVHELNGRSWENSINEIVGRTKHMKRA